MKLALIVPGGFHPGRRENVIPALLGLAGELATRHEVHVFAFGGPGSVSRHSLLGAQVHQLGDPSTIDPARWGRNARLLVRLAWQLGREFERATAGRPFQVLHAFWANEPGFLTGLLGRLSNLPVVVSVGGGEAVWIPEIRYGGGRSILGRSLVALSLRLANEVTAGSHFALSFLPPAIAKRAKVVPLGTDCRRFDASPDRVVGPPYRLLHVGSLNPVKDHGTLFQAFARVLQRLPDVTLDCVGEDTLDGAIHSLAVSLGLGDRVHFHGYVSNDELGSHYRSAHLNVLSSRYESQSVAVLEAAAAGLPTIGTAVGVVPTLSPQAACSVPPGDAQALSDSICALLTDEGRRRAMGEAAQAFVRAHDIGWTARSFEEIYTRLANG